MSELLYFELAETKSSGRTWAQQNGRRWYVVGADGPHVGADST